MKAAVRFSTWVGFFAVLTVAMESCMGAPGVPCGNDYCPVGYTCHEGDTCLSPGSEPDQCGNSIQEPEIGEQCDDGNKVSGDNCSNICQLEVCGNAIPDPGEECDCGYGETSAVGGLPNCLSDYSMFALWNIGGEMDTVVVPKGTSEAEFRVWGGGGGGGAPGPGGGGAWLHATFGVTAGDVLEVRVASGGDEQGGGAGASYVLRNGQIVLVAAGGGGGGHDGCTGCSQEQDSRAGMGGGGGPVGGNGQDGWANNYYGTNSGAGRGGDQTSGGAGGISNDRNRYGWDPCTADGLPGLEHQGGRAVVCGGYEPPAAQGHLGGGGIGNGSSGGGGSGWFGGGSGAAKYTYSGGGGGGGASWIHPSARLLGTEGGNGQEPGGQNATGYQNDTGRGGDPQLVPFGATATSGQRGLIILLSRRGADR